MNKDRLIELKRFLNDLPEDRKTNHFDLDSWVRTGRATDADICVPKAAVPNSELADTHLYAVNPADIVELAGTCGTSACAVGWACSNPVFNQMGLHMTAYEEEMWDEEQGQMVIGLAGFTPHYSGHENWEAVEAFFGLDAHGARDLFDSEFYAENPTINDVIARIGKVLEE